MSGKKGGGSPIDGFLNTIERLGNKLPDPAVLFVWALFATWLLSWAMSGTEYSVPAKGGLQTAAIVNQFTPSAISQFLVDMVGTFTGFHPLGVVLVALLGVGVAEESRLHQRRHQEAPERPRRTCC